MNTQLSNNQTIIALNTQLTDNSIRTTVLVNMHNKICHFDELTQFDKSAIILA